MTNGEILDGWKVIADYVGKSVKTIQRWEAESGFPVHRVTGRRTVYALRAEVDAWLSGQGDGSSDRQRESERPVSSRWEWLFRPRRVSPVLLIVLVLFLVVLIVFDGDTVRTPSPVPERRSGELRVVVEPCSEGSMFRVRNDRGREALALRMRGDWGAILPMNPGWRLFWVSDLTHDGLDDLLLFTRDSPDPGLEFWRQQPDGGLVPDRVLPLSDVVRYEGVRYRITRYTGIWADDLDGDGDPEVVVIGHHYSLYPSVLTAMTLDGERLLTVEHPGRLAHVQVRRLDGDAVIFTAGTNNFITTYSEPVVFRIRMDWRRRGVRFSLLRPGRKLAAQVPAGVSLTYVRLGDFPECPGVSPWERATIRRPGWGCEMDQLMVEAGYYDSLKGGRPLADGGRMKEIRLFEMDASLAPVHAEYNSLVAAALAIDSRQAPWSSLLAPRYWNGRDWQDTVCTVPCAANVY